MRSQFLSAELTESPRRRIGDPGAVGSAILMIQHEDHSRVRPKSVCINGRLERSGDDSRRFSHFGVTPITDSGHPRECQNPVDSTHQLADIPVHLLTPDEPS